MKVLLTMATALFLVVTASAIASSTEEASPPSAPTGQAATARGGACPPNATDIWPGNDIASIINNGDTAESFCVHGFHRVDETISPKAEQRLFGVDDARISGGQELTGWTSHGSYWSYSGPLAANRHVFEDVYNDGAPVCYEVSIYQDDVYYDDQRMMRVLSLDQLHGIAELPDGQAETEAEFGRFFFDYDNDVIYVDKNPNGATVDLAVLEYLISSDKRDVELHNLTLEKARTAIVDATFASGWTIADSTVRFAHNVGVAVGSGREERRFRIANSVVTNNGLVGLIGPAEYLEVRDTELSWNNIANYRKRQEDRCTNSEGAAGARLFGAYVGTESNPALIVSGVEAHHNLADGVHLDIHVQHALIAKNNFHHNEKAGYVHEISCDAQIIFNEIANNGLQLKNEEVRGGGVILNVSNNVEIANNRFTGNYPFSILLSHGEHSNLAGIPCMNVSSDTDISDGLKNNRIEDNLVQMCEGVVGAKSETNLLERNNVFDGNRYLVPDSSERWWLDAEAMGRLTWSDWQAGGQDATGMVVQGGHSLCQQE